jgi:hypothetical protein
MSPVMHARLFALSAFSLPLAFGSLAHAQAPGAVGAQPVVMVPESACVACGCNRPETVMSRRWAVGLSLGSMTLAPDARPDDKTAFAVGELALRFRATRHLELELAVGGGRERTADDMDGDLQVTTAALALRYRFRAEQHWNWFVMGGLGGAAIARHDATSQERSDATQPMLELGVGTEYRFDHLALQAELRGFGLGVARSDSSSDPAASMPFESNTTNDIQRSGASLSVGLSYYF